MWEHDGIHEDHVVGFGVIGEDVLGVAEIEADFEAEEEYQRRLKEGGDDIEQSLSDNFFGDDPFLPDLPYDF